MGRNIGETVYKYTLKKGKMFIHEGVVHEGLFKTMISSFKDSGTWDLVPANHEFGRVDSKGPSLWLTERDDDLARQLFIAYEEKCLAKLQKQINEKTKLIKILKSGVAE